MSPSLVLEIGLVVGLREAITLLRSGGREGVVGRLEGVRLEGGRGAEGRFRFGIGVSEFKLKF